MNLELKDLIYEVISRVLPFLDYLIQVDYNKKE